MTTVVSIEQGGTGANNAADARALLGIGSSTEVVNAANTVRVSANSGSTLSSKQLNFVNTSTVIVTVSDSGNGNANVSFTSSGIQGIQGIQGPAAGPQGTTGAQGTQGIQGIQGLVGTGIEVKGAVFDPVDLPMVGNTVGDVYFVTFNGNLYVWNGSSWDDVGQVSGPVGPQGATGIQGIQGVQGQIGPQGIQGITGIQGTQGIQGIQGIQGPQGTQGVQGTQGIQGLQGLQGIQGIQGPQGTQGVQGLDGAFVAQGIQGIQGLAGTSAEVNIIEDNANTAIYPVMATATGTASTLSITPSKFLFNASTGELKSKLRSYTENVIAQTVTSGSYTANLSLSNIFDLTLQSSATTITFTNAPPSGTAIPVTLILRQPSTAGNTVSYANTVQWSNGEVPVLSSGIANKLDIVTFYTVNGGSIFYGGHALANVG